MKAECRSQNSEVRSLKLAAGWAAGLALLIISLLLFTGCGTLDPGEDPVVVRAEQTIDGTFATLDGFVTHNHLHRAWYREHAREAHQFAENLREKVPPLNERRAEAIVRNARGALETYKRSRTAENATALNAALDVLTDLATRATTYQLLRPETQ
jgi:hypothetical protein